MEGYTVNFVILIKVYEVIGWKVWKRNTEEEKLENNRNLSKNFLVIKKKDSGKRSQVSIHKIKKYLKGKSILSYNPY